MFNTGDLGRWRPDGQLDHLGRIDDQVKVKGFRVELDGVAAALEVHLTFVRCHARSLTSTQTHAKVRSATALLIDDTLWGFVTAEDIEIEDIKKAAAKVQPYYAVPTQILIMQEFPLTR